MSITDTGVEWNGDRLRFSVFFLRFTGNILYYSVNMFSLVDQLADAGWLWPDLSMRFQALWLIDELPRHRWPPDWVSKWQRWIWWTAPANVIHFTIAQTRWWFHYVVVY